MSGTVTGKPQIEIRGVHKSYGPNKVVDGIDLRVARGELFSLLGASGCGKTTLLRMLAGFVTPDSGAIEIDGVDQVPLAPFERPVNMMFQSYALFPHMNVEDNVAFGLRRDGVDKAEVTRRVGEALALVRLSDFTRRKPAQLSGGQSQRVALARALVKRPKVLLLDEPLSALDKQLRESTRLELVQIQEQVGTTFVMVTHDQEEAMSMSSRIAVMDQGRIIQQGTPAEIYEMPQSRFVAAFIGSVNLFSGLVKESHPNGSWLACPDAGCDIAVADGGLEPGEAATLAIRPEMIALSRPGAAAPGLNQINGTVASVAYFGSSVLYQLRANSGMLIKVSMVTPQRHVGLFDRDDPIVLSWNENAGRLLRQ